jgi:hypothetical protein
MIVDCAIEACALRIVVAVDSYRMVEMEIQWLEDASGRDLSSDASHAPHSNLSLMWPSAKDLKGFLTSRGPPESASAELETVDAENVIGSCSVHDFLLLRHKMQWRRHHGNKVARQRRQR